MIVLFCFMFAASSAGELQRLTREVAASGQVVELAARPSDRVAAGSQIAPGAPPLLAFRYYDGQQRHRFNGTELMLDDAGH
jgi:hypothetical protein